MTKQNERLWTVELNIGSKRNMGNGKRQAWTMPEIYDKVGSRLESKSNIKSIFEFKGEYENEIEISYYVSFLAKMEYMEASQFNKLKDILLILCMELEQECIAYNIKELLSGSADKQNLIYHPNYEGEQIVFNEQYFMSYSHHQLDNRMTNIIRITQEYIDNIEVEAEEVKPLSKIEKLNNFVNYNRYDG